MVFNNMDQANQLIDPQDEVKKLQDLVKKLEKQNELLRGKQKLQTQTIDSHLSNNAEDAKPVVKNTDNVKSKLDRDSLKGLDDVEIVNVNELSLREEEESWLYSSPKAPTPQQTKVSPYKWVRQEFDHPSPELESGRKSLLSKMDEVARTGSNRVDTGTFTRPRKNKLRINSTEKENDYCDDSASDVTDIEAVAKLQEESLRQSITHHPSPRKDNGVLERYRNSIDSDGSSPPDSPHTSQHPYNYDAYGGKRNLTKMNKLQQYSSDSSLDHQSVGSDEANLAPETRPVSRLHQPNIRSQSPGYGLKQPSNLRRAVSPARSGLPQPMTRRSIPRPSTGRTSLPSPRRSNIPSPRPFGNAEGEDSWREGCF